MKHELPEELRKELAYYKGPGAALSGRDLVLSYMANAKRGCTTNELLTYVWSVNRTVMKRTYFYQMVYKLRVAGLIITSEELTDGVKTFEITEAGRAEAQPFVRSTAHGTG